VSILESVRVKIGVKEWLDDIIYNVIKKMTFLKYFFVYANHYVKFNFDQPGNFELESCIQNATYFHCIYVGRQTLASVFSLGIQINHQLILQHTPSKKYLNYKLQLSNIPSVWTCCHCFAELYTASNMLLFWENNRLVVDYFIRDLNPNTKSSDFVQLTSTCLNALDFFQMNNFVVIDNMDQMYKRFPQIIHCLYEEDHINYYYGNGLNYYVLDNNICIKSLQKSIRTYLSVYTNIKYLYINTHLNNYILNIQIPDIDVRSSIKYSDTILPVTILIENSIILSTKKLKFGIKLKNLLRQFVKYHYRF